MKYNELALEFIAYCCLFIGILLALIYMAHYVLQNIIGVENMQALDCLSC